MIVIHSLQQRSLENIRIALPQFVVVAVGESQISRAIGLEIHTQNLFLYSVQPGFNPAHRLGQRPDTQRATSIWLANQAGCVFPAGRGSHERQGRIWWGCFSTSWTGAALAQPCDRAPQSTARPRARWARKQERWHWAHAVSHYTIAPFITGCTHLRAPGVETLVALVEFDVGPVAQASPGLRPDDHSPRQTHGEQQYI